ncbi:SPFH/Band 7/PHB domain protein [Hyphobacterium sp. SN044]|uniref:SPFH domain-containing protein n=1 Tax=Hyphobacterium sp. SN044 TaxID=2912575 RepID=UPI001F3C68AF|nr:SPFH domain-containing protein [Hyphobacterium sp. SN044]MCF8880898.1 SPFH/Band 7/PHB domain protein [Hyphobacterium sp. SN044]
MGGFIVVGIIVVLAFLIVAGTIKVVPQGMEFTVERFGRFTRRLTPGLHILMPFMDSVRYKINMRERVLDVPKQEVITRDNAMVSVDAVVFIQVMDAARAAYEVDNLDFAIINLAMTNVRTVVGSMDLDQVLSNRDDINARLLSVIDAATNPWGVKVTRIEIRDLSPPPDITEAMARQMKAERLKRAEILEAEGQKQSQILKAEGEKQSQILEAEGRREAAFRDAEAREREAEAEAKATDMVSKSIAEGDMNAINYFLGLKYVEAFGKLAESNQQRTVIVPADFANLTGMVAGLKALVEDNGGTGGTGGGGAAPSAGGGRKPAPWGKE